MARVPAKVEYDDMFSNMFITDNVICIEEGTWMSVTVNGISSMDTYNRKAKLDSMGLARYLECVRVACSRHSNYFLHSARKMDSTIFLLVMNYEFTPLFYKRAKLGMPISFEGVVTLAGFTRTGVCVVTFLYDIEDHELLGKLKTKVIVVNWASRKSMPIEESFKDRYKSYVKPSEMCVPFQSPQRQKGQYVHVYKMQIKPSDTDWNNHVNFATFITMCLDCAADASKKGLFSHFPVDIANYNVKMLDIIFDRECLLGETLSVLCWEDENDPLLLHFEILKPNSILAVHSKITFYPLQASYI